jgi:hypothetical protein
MLTPSSLDHACSIMLLLKLGDAESSHRLLNGDCCTLCVAILIAIKKHSIQSLYLGQCPLDLLIVLVALSSHTLKRLDLHCRIIFSTCDVELMALYVPVILFLGPVSLSLQQLFSFQNTDPTLDWKWMHVTP